VGERKKKRARTKKEKKLERENSAGLRVDSSTRLCPGWMGGDWGKGEDGKKDWELAEREAPQG